jgi:uncharacterized protein (TIGR03118 family)
MKRRTDAHRARPGRWSVAVAATAFLVLGAALVGPAGATSATSYRQTNLVSDIPGVARVTDANLVNPWGLAELPNGPLWVADNGADVATIYVGAQHGSPLTAAPLVVPIPGGAPTGQVANTGSQFMVTDGTNTASARFLFDSENGDITAWSPTVVPTTPVVHVPKAVYKGLAIASIGSSSFLYATNFHAGTIDMFDGTFAMVPHPGRFVDSLLPPGYAPFGIANIGGELYVSYALQDAKRHDDSRGPGHGFIDVYSLDGHLLRRLVQGGDLNSPWGMIMATKHFGTFSNDLLVGNFGDGMIHAYDPMTGAELGTVTNPDGGPVQINGLWGLIYGDAAAGTPNTLFFSAGIADEAHGLLGTLTPGG